MFLQTILVRSKMIPWAIISLAVLLPSLLVVGNTTLDPAIVCDECVVVELDPELGADDQDLAGNYK